MTMNDDNKELLEKLPEAKGLCEECRTTKLDIRPHGALCYCEHNRTGGMIFLASDKALMWTMMTPCTRSFFNTWAGMLMGHAVDKYKQAEESYGI
jgi:hypothetical protein